MFNADLEVSLKSTTALPIHNHALIPTGLLLTVPDELLLAVLQVASPPKTLAVRVGTPLLTEPPIMSALVNLTMLYRSLGCLLLTVLVTIITDRPERLILYLEAINIWSMPGTFGLLENK